MVAARSGTDVKLAASDAHRIDHLFALLDSAVDEKPQNPDFVE